MAVHKDSHEFIELIENTWRLAFDSKSLFTNPVGAKACEREAVGISK